MLKLLFHSFQFIDTPYISGSLLPAAAAPAFCNGPMDKRETASFCIGIIPLASAGANHSQALEHIFSHGQISKLTFFGNMSYKAGNYNLGKFAIVSQISAFWNWKIKR